MLQQHGGAAAAADLRRLVGWRRIRILELSQELIRPTRTVVQMVGCADDLQQQIQRAEVVIGRRLIACLFTAGALEGFAVLSDGRIHVTTADGWSAKPPPGFVLHQLIPRSAVVEIGGVLAISPADTAIDLACAGSDIDVLAVLDAAMRSGITRSEFATAIDRARGRRGIAKVRGWLPFADWRADSPMESRLRFRFLDNGFPPPDLQIAVPVSSGRTRYLDLGWRKYRVGCDYDGEQFHGGASLTADRQRHNEVAETGWRMFYPTAPDVYQQSASFLAKIGGALESAGCTSIGMRPSPASVPGPAGDPADLLARSRRLWSSAAAPECSDLD